MLRTKSVFLSAATGSVLLAASSVCAQTLPTYLMADGSKTADYEEALESWRTHLPFKADYAKAYLGLEHAYARGLSGQGVTLAVNDSGIYWDHPVFGGQSNGLDTGASDALGNHGSLSSREPWHSHGTHVAGTAAGRRLEGGLMFGAAYGADLYSATTHFAGRNLSFGPAYFAGEGLASGIDNLVAIAASGQARLINNSWGVPQSQLRYDASMGEIERFFEARRDEITQPDWQAVIDQDALVIMSTGNDAGYHASQWNMAPHYAPQLNGHFLSVTNYGADDVHDGSSLCGATATWCLAGPGRQILSAIPDFSLDAQAWNAAYDYMDLLRDADFLADYESIGLARAIPAALDRKLDGFIAARDAARQTGAAFDTEAELNRLGLELSQFSKTLLSLLINPKPNIGLDAASLINSLNARVGQGLSANEAQAIAQTYSDDLLAALHQQMGEVRPAYGYASGTSMAAPNITGFAALLMEQFPDYGSPLISDILLSSGRDIGEAGVDIASGWGVPQMQAALEGPSALLAQREVRVVAGRQDIWTHDISDAVDRYSPLVRERNPDDIGGLIKLGGGELVLTGSSTYSGQTQVNEGLLTLQGRLTRSPLTVQGLGMVRGTGQLASLVARDGGVVAPGDTANPFGRLSVSGDARFEAGSYLWVRTSVDAREHSQLAVAGTLALDGGQVLVKADTGAWSLRRRGIEIVTAAGGITGAFEGVTSDLGFLTPSLSYQDQSVQLQLVRNDVAIASAGRTTNARAVGSALDQMVSQNNSGDLALEDAILDGSFDAVQAALPALSGEVHPALIGTGAQAAEQLRQLVLDRGHGQGQGLSLWASALTGSGKVSANGDHSGLDQTSSGLAAGVDRTLGQSGLIGAAISQTRASVEMDGIQAEGDATFTQASLYGRQQVRRLSLSAGASWISASADSRRSLGLNAFSNRLSADYQADGWQVWGEAALGLQIGASQIAPYVGYSHYQLEGEMAESGGDAALHGGFEHRSDVVSLGLRTRSQIAKDRLHLVANLAVNKDLNEEGPRLGARFADGPSFTVVSAQAHDASLTTQLGLEFTPRENLRLDVGYSGLHGSDVQDNRLFARVSLSF